MPISSGYNNRSDCYRVDSSIESDEVWSKSNEWKFMAKEFWQLIDDLIGGTKCMRERGEQWLPKEPGEHDTKYRNRLRRSFLYPGYRDAIDKIAAKPFSKPLVIKEVDAVDFPIQFMLNDIDRTGQDINAFARDFMAEAIHRGHCHILVDFPKTSGQQNAAQEQSGEVRPYWRIISPRDMLGIKTLRLENGQSYMSQIRFYEKSYAETGMYNSSAYPRIRVINAPQNGQVGTWELWERGIVSGQEAWSLRDSGTHTYPGIPITTCYLSEKLDEGVTEPALDMLAWTNLAHWQSYSDHRNILRFARTGMYFAKGFSAEEVSQVVIGPDQIAATANTEGDLSVLEYEGKAIEHSIQDLRDLEDLMSQLALAPFLDRARFSTATEIVSTESKSETVIQEWVRRVEFAFFKAFEISAFWLRKKLPEGFKVNIFNEFGISGKTSKEILDTLLAMRKGSDISRKVLINEMKRRGIIAEDISVEEIEADLEEEGMDIVSGGDITADNMLTQIDEGSNAG